MSEEMELIRQLQVGSVKALKTLCYGYAEDMLIFAYGLLHDNMEAEKVVCDILLDLWCRDGCRDLRLPLHIFLYGEIKIQCEILLARRGTTR